MSRTLGLRVLTGLLASLLALAVVAAPAQAGPRPPDPERANPPASARPRTSAASPDAAPAVIDSDLYAYAQTPSFRTYFVVAGHLKLKLKSGTTNRYSGTFVDYVGNKSSKATANTINPAAPKLSFTSKNGKFLFQLDANFGGTFYSGTGLTVPATLKTPAGQVSVAAQPHAVRSATYDVVLSERSGPVSNPFEYVGTLTLVYDANSRISGGQITVTDSKGRNVTHSLRNSGFYSSTYFYTVAQVNKTYFGLTATVTGTSFSGFGFAGGGSTTSQWIVNGTA